MCWRSPGRARHPMVLVFGLMLSIALMGLAASMIARLLQRHRWIAYLGLACDPLSSRRHDGARRAGLKPIVQAAVAML